MVIKNTYNAKMASMPIFLTILFILFVIVACYFFLFQADMALIYKYTLVALFLIILIVLYLLHPTKYEITDNYIFVKSPLFTLRKINIDDIIDIKEIDYEKLYLRTRIYASRGFFGYFGVFFSSYYGRFSMYSSNLKDLIFIATRKREIIIISPEQKLDFLKNFTT